MGGVLSHLIDGVEVPVCFASTTLSESENNYGQLKALAIIFCVKKFLKYIWGQEFTLVSDHQPLKNIFSPVESIPVHSAAHV